MSDIFISYASEDKEKAGILAEVFEEQGWLVWWDYGIRTGDSFADVIEREIGLSKCVVVLWSKRSILSRWVKNEASEGAERNILAPVLIQEVNKIPIEFKHIHAANLIGWQGEKTHPVLNKLIEDVGNILGIQRENVTNETLKHENKKIGLQLCPDEKIETKPAIIERTGIEPIEKPPVKSKAEEEKKHKSKKQHDAAMPSTATKRSRLSWLLPTIIVPFIFVMVVLVFQLTYTVYSSKESVEAMIKDKGFYDKIWNYSASGFHNDYELQNDGKVVYDRASNIMWQQSGSNQLLLYKNAKLYIKGLNRNKYAGYNDWRLPSVEEAMTLVEPTKKNGKLYIDSIFGTNQSKIWTSEPYSASSNWSVHFEGGGPSNAWTVNFNVGNCFAGSGLAVYYSGFVRAVR